MKTQIISLCTVFMLSASTIAADAAAAVTVKVNDAPLISDVEPQMVNDRIMLPMRAVFETLGAEVEWDPNNQMIFAVRGERIIAFKIGSDKLIIQSITEAPVTVTLDAAPYILDDRTMIPLRAAAEALGAKVGWDGELREAYVRL